MPWKKGKVRFDDGSSYEADMLVKEDGQVWNMKIHKENGIVEEINASEFASKFGKTPEQVYPFTYQIEE